MSGILQGKTAVIAGIANRWSIAWAITESFVREGASLVLTYVNDKQREAIESMTAGMPVIRMLATASRCVKREAPSMAP